MDGGPRTQPGAAAGGPPFRVFIRRAYTGFLQQPKERLSGQAIVPSGPFFRRGFFIVPNKTMTVRILDGRHLQDEVQLSRSMLDQRFPKRVTVFLYYRR